MRKILLALITVLLMGVGQAFAVTPGYQQNPGTGDIMGQGKYQSDPHKTFRMVRYVPATYSGATTLAADSIVIWDLASDDGVTVTTSTTSSDSAVAGVIVAQALTPDTDGNTAAQDRGKGNWTWLQTYGSSQVNFAPTTGAINVTGQAFGTSTTAGEAAAFLPSTTDAKRQGNAGIAYDTAVAGDDDVQVFIRLE